MEKNLYFQRVVRRDNILKDLLFDGFVKACSYPRLFLEVFIRSNFGQRYFNFASALTTAFLLAVIPAIIHVSVGVYTMDVLGEALPEDRPGFWSQYLTWYLAIAGFLFFAWKRRQEIKRNPSTFDFARFSLYSGDILHLFYDIPVRFNWPVTIRKIETLYEPAFFMGIGLLLWLPGQNVGLLIMVCSLLYSLGHAGQYHRADNFILNKIDQIIMNEGMEDAFVDEIGPSETRGVRFHCEKPFTRADRQKLARYIAGNDDIDDPLSCA